MDIEKTMILVKDEDKTETVVAVSFDIASRKTQVTYTGGHSYFYNSANVLVLENPKSIDLNGRVAYVNGMPVYDPRLILDFKNRIRIIQKNGTAQSVKPEELSIVENGSSDKNIQRILAYLREISRHTANDPAEEAFLKQEMDPLTFVHPESVLGQYLNRRPVENRTPPMDGIIFPFRFNLSQKSALENALAHSMSVIEGPPGTGKTLLAKAVASESEANFISIKGPELLSKWVGESEQGVREVFRKAKQTAPTVIFFDEIDSIASTRSANDSDSGVTKRVVNQLLTEMDGLEELEDVAIIAATNRPDILDAGLMRPGRFDRHIKVDLPNEDARLSIFKVHTEGMPLADDVSLEKLAKQTDGYVGADIEAVCREAAMLTLRNNLDAENVPYKYFKEALEKVKPSNSPGDQVQYI